MTKNNYLKKPERTFEEEGVINKEQRYVITQGFKIPIPEGINIDAIERKYIFIISIFHANTNFKLRLRPQCYCQGACMSMCDQLEKHVKKFRKPLKLRKNASKKTLLEYCYERYEEAKRCGAFPEYRETDLAIRRQAIEELKKEIEEDKLKKKKPKK